MGRIYDVSRILGRSQDSDKKTDAQPSKEPKPVSYALVQGVVIGLLAATLFGAFLKPATAPVAVHRGDTVVFIYETSPAEDEFSTAATNLAGQDKFWFGLRQRGLQYGRLDDDSSAIGPKTRSLMTGKKLPLLAILDNSEPVIVEESPKTIDAIDARIREVTGK